MYPELFSIGPFTVHSFGLMMALGFLSAGVAAYYGFRKKGLDPETVYWLTIAAAVGGIIGSKVHYLLLHLDEIKDDPLVSTFSGAGLVWYGGLIGGLAAAWGMSRLYKLKFARVLDAATPALAIGYAFGRMGCFLNGDDYGRPSDLPWAMEFPDGSPPTPPDVAVQPTQLYEVTASLVIFGVLIFLWPRLKRDWAMFCAYLIMAGLERFLVEFVRFQRGGQVQMQVLALATAIVAAAVLIRIYRRPEVR